MSANDISAGFPEPIQLRKGGELENILWCEEKKVGLQFTQPDKRFHRSVRGHD